MVENYRLGKIAQGITQETRLLKLGPRERGEQVIDNIKKQMLEINALRAENEMIIPRYDNLRIRNKKLSELLRTASDNAEEYRKDAEEAKSLVEEYERRESEEFVEKWFMPVSEEEVKKTNPVHCGYTLASKIIEEQVDKETFDVDKVEFAKFGLFNALNSNQESIVEETVLLGDSLFILGRYDLAEVVFNEITKTQDTNTHAWKKLAKAIRLGKDNNTEERKEWIKFCEYKANSEK